MTDATPEPAPNRKRQLRNYLLDARFQLKFSAYLIGATLVVAGLLGAVLWKSTEALLRESQLAVEARSQAVETSKDLGRAALSDELLSKFDDPVFAEQLRHRSEAIDQRYEAEKAAILTQKSELLYRQEVMFRVLFGGLGAFVLAIALASIVATHKIVGPLYRIRRIVQGVAGGSLKVGGPNLRHGDEFQELFTDFTRMIEEMRARTQADLDLVEKALAVSDRNEWTAAVEALRARLRQRLE